MKKILLPFLTVALLLGCSKKTQDVDIPFDNRFAEFISAFSRGTISKKDNIKVEFTDVVSLPDELPSGLFKIAPSVDGKLVKTGQSIVFSPDKPLTSGTQYVVDVALKKLVEVPEDMSTFQFAVKTFEQDFNLEVEELRTTDLTNPAVVELNGTLVTADFEENETIEKILKVEGRTIQWDHSGGNTHRFVIAGIKRGDSRGVMKIMANGSAIGSSRTEEKEVQIPSVKEFYVLSASYHRTGDQYVSVFFSDPIQRDQTLDGLFQLDGESNPRYVINGNEVQIYLSRQQSGTRTLQIFEGIKNSFGYKLGVQTSRSIAFDPEKPRFKLLGKGTILPSTDGLVLPFEAVNLKTLRVDIIQVRPQNVASFLQVNSLDGDEQMRRVGKRIMRKTIDLSIKGADLTNWNRFTLDLGDILKTEKGALYQLQFHFKPQDVVYPCSELVTMQDNEDEKETWSIYDYDGFDSWGGYYFEYPDEYDWDEREDPCSPSYYVPSKFAQRNLMASDLGLMAKIGADNSMNLYATNMVSAMPVKAQVELFDYQLESLGKAATDDKGMVQFNPARRPFLAVAEAEGMMAYLKLDDGSALSMSNFDVSGERIRSGLKGFIYGERGVWRPGDDIFLSFMLEDGTGQLPEDHPVVLEFKDPMDNLHTRQVSTRGVKGLYTFKLKTDEADMTGNWKAKVSVGNSSFHKTIKIETIKPNRLKINFDLPEKVITYDQRRLNSKLSANWLTGIKGSGLKTETTLSLSQVKTTFDAYNQYEFDDLTKRFDEDKGIIFSGNTNEEGVIQFAYELPATKSASGALKAVLSTKAFEPGGDFSINNRSLMYHPYSSFVGIKMPEGDRYGRLKIEDEHTIGIMTLSSEGTPISRDNINLRIYRLDWRWWWDQSEDYSLNYITSGNRTPVVNKNVSVNGGKGQVSFKLNRDSWGRHIAILTDPVSGHSSSTIFYAGWAGDSKQGLGASFLQVSANKDEFEVGQEIEITIPGSSLGQALVSVENGSRVLENFWIQTQKGNTTFKVKTTPEMAPNIYVHITLLQPHAQTVNDLPIRMYGIVPIKVYDPGTVLQPVISMAKELAPGKEVSIKVSEKSGKSMSYTLAMVDEGLLDITNFKTPDPWSHFYRKEAIGVKSWDIYDHVIGAFGGRLERLLAIGGDEEIFDADKKKSDNRFKPVVLFMGPFYLKSGESKSHSFTMPQYIGSVKTMVVAGSAGAYGAADQATPVVQPLMVLGTLPRVTGPGEAIRLPVNVFKFAEGINNASLTVETIGVIKTKGSTSTSINLSDATSTAFFDLMVDKRMGSGKVTITAKSGKHTATHEITIESRAPNLPQTKVTSVTLEPGKSYEGTLDVFGMPGTNEATLEVSSIPPMNLEQRLNYLIRYPHGCIEQTTSSVFPQLYLDKVVKLSDEQKIRIEQNIKEGINRLGSFQTHSGGLSYWPGSSETNNWGTTYAFHFLVEAQKRGYSVPNDLINKIRKFQNTQAKAWTKNSDYYNDDMVQAYRLYTLALAGDEALGSMNRMMEMSGLTAQAQWKLAGAYALLGRKDVALNLATKAGTKASPYDYRYSYGSSERDMAMLLEMYVHLQDKTEAFKVFKELAKKLSGDRWMSTQTVAYSLMAMGKFLNANAQSDKIAASVSYNGKTSEWQSDLPVIRESLATNAGNKSIKISNKGNGVIFLSLTTSGTPYPGAESARSSGLKVDVAYRDTNGATADVSSLKQGTTLEATVRVTNQSPMGFVKDVALGQIFPSGWEIDNQRLSDDTFSSSNFAYQDIRDDRIYTYFDLRQGETKTFKVKLTATYAGRYYMPGVVAEAMYDASTSGSSEGKWVEVIE